MVKYNSLKIFINATEAKPGGNIGAMLSPYLFSTNMADFCKRFNEQSKIFLNTVLLPVKIYTNSVDKTYTFLIKNLSISLFLIFWFSLFKKLSLTFCFDLVLFYSKLYHLSLFKSSLIVFSILKTFKKKFSIIEISSFLIFKFNKNV